MDWECIVQYLSKGWLNEVIIFFIPWHSSDFLKYWILSFCQEFSRTVSENLAGFSHFVIVL